MVYYINILITFLLGIVAACIILVFLLTYRQQKVLKKVKNLMSALDLKKKG